MSKSRQIRIAERLFNILPLAGFLSVVGGILYIISMRIASIFPHLSPPLTWLGVVCFALALLLLPIGLTLSGLWGMYTGFFVASYSWWMRNKEELNSYQRLIGLLSFLAGIGVLFFYLALLKGWMYKGDEIFP